MRTTIQAILFCLAPALPALANGVVENRTAQAPDANDESPRLSRLEKELEGGGGQGVLDAFWKEMQGKTPIVEAIPGNDREMRVTFVWRGSKETRSLGMLGSNPFPDPTGRQWKRLRDTDLWYKIERMPSDARFGYAISENGGPFKSDPLNPNTFAGRSVAELPKAPEERSIEKKPKVPQGTLTKHRIRSESLDEDRSIGVYLPAGYSGQDEPYPLLVVFDGESHGSRPESAIQLPTILDNLFEMKKLPPLVAVLVDSQGTRDRDLLCADRFSNFLANELVPWCRQKYRISRDPSRAVLAGESYGGLCAAYTAFRHSDVFGNVLSLSGTFSYHQNWGQKKITDYYSVETGWLTRQLASHPKLPIRFSLAVGRFEAGPEGGLLRENRHLRDVLEARGYRVAYSEYSGGHDYVGWRIAFIKGLISLIGSAEREPAAPSVRKSLD
jgi:enterochelin esterase family protein